MEMTKELGAWKDSAANMLCACCYSPSSSSWHRHSQSAPDDGLLEDFLNMSPRSSQYSNFFIKFFCLISPEKRHWPKMGMTDEFKASLQVLWGFDTDISFKVDEIKELPYWQEGRAF